MAPYRDAQADPAERDFWERCMIALLSDSRVDGSEDAASIADGALQEWRKRWTLVGRAGEGT